MHPGQRRVPSARCDAIQLPSRLETYRQALEDELKDVFASRQGFLYDMLRYHLGWIDQQGQTLDTPLSLSFEPTLALAVCDAMSGGVDPAMPAAAGVELVRNFTLVHTDVQSARTESQDRPSVWWVWGPAQAINAGDGLHALGRTTMMRLSQRGAPAQRVLRSVQAMDRACLALCEGQYMELDFQDRQLVTAEAYYDMISLRAGSLTGCSAELGALAVGAQDPVYTAFNEMGRQLGMAWQITRDVAGMWGSHDDGITASNALDKKKSLPLIHAMETATVAGKRELANIYVKRVLEPDDMSRIIEILDQTGSREFAESKAQELADRAMAVVSDAGDAAGLTPGSRDGLQGLAQWALEGPI